MEKRIAIPVVIASGTSLSPAVDLQEFNFGGIFMPSAWDAASISIQVSFDGITFNELYDEWYAGPVVVTAGQGATASGCWIANASHLGPIPRFIKLRSGTSGAPVNQTANRTLFVLGGAVSP